jgi:hypothetical protein
VSGVIQPAAAVDIHQNGMFYLEGVLPGWNIITLDNVRKDGMSSPLVIYELAVKG